MKQSKTKPVDQENPRHVPDVCPYCGLNYADFKTGQTFATIKESMYVASDVPEKWVYKRRSGVLGRWHELKQSLWADHLAYHEADTGEAGKEAPDATSFDFSEF